MKLLNILITEILFTNIAFKNILLKYYYSKFKVRCPQLSRMVFSIRSSSLDVVLWLSYTTEEFEYVLTNLNTVSHTSCLPANLWSSLRARERTIGRFPLRLRHRCLKRAAAPRCCWQQTTSWRWLGCQLSVFFPFKNPNHFLYLLLTIIF